MYKVEYIPKQLEELVFRLRQNPGDQRSKTGLYCLNTNPFAIFDPRELSRGPKTNFSSCLGIHKQSEKLVFGSRESYPELMFSMFHIFLAHRESATSTNRSSSLAPSAIAFVGWIDSALARSPWESKIAVYRALYEPEKSGTSSSQT